ncbi:MAG: hypothetical protein DCC66_04815 [Planctomycetota bacterium]|nr:MAG: hypothetical protein DCC66_04815 [Planctomycetota bacterium]
MGEAQVSACVLLFYARTVRVGWRGRAIWKIAPSRAAWPRPLTAMRSAVLASLPTRRDDGRMNGRLE